MSDPTPPDRSPDPPSGPPPPPVTPSGAPPAPPTSTADAPPAPATGPIGAPPPRKRSKSMMAFLIIGAVVVALAIGGVVLAVALFAGAGSYEDNGVAFEYPKDWVETSEKTVGAQVGDELWSTGAGPIPEDGNTEELTADVVLVTAYRLTQEVNEENVATIEPELRGVLDQLVEQSGTSWPGELSRRTVDGSPAFVAEGVEAVGPQQQPVESRVVFVFDGTTQYFINCQYEPPLRSEILAGCDQVLDTFSID